MNPATHATRVGCLVIPRKRLLSATNKRCAKKVPTRSSRTSSEPSTHTSVPAPSPASISAIYSQISPEKCLRRATIAPYSKKRTTMLTSNPRRRWSSDRGNNVLSLVFEADTLSGYVKLELGLNHSNAGRSLEEGVIAVFPLARRGFLTDHCFFPLAFLARRRRCTSSSKCVLCYFGPPVTPSLVRDFFFLLRSFLARLYSCLTIIVCVHTNEGPMERAA